MMRYTVDRIEGKEAILIDDNEQTTVISVDFLPCDAKEGSVLLLGGERYVLDSAATSDRRKEASDLIDELFV